MNGWSNSGKRTKEAFWSLATRGSKKDSDRAITPAAEAGCALHTGHHQGPYKPSSCTTFMPNPHWGQSYHSQKVLCLSTQGCFGHVWIFVTLWTVACQDSLLGRGVLQARILEPIGQCWLPYPSRALYAALATNSPDYLVLPEPPWPKQLHHLHTWPSLGPCLQGSLRANPSGRPTCRSGNKTTTGTQGECG